jgi:hypothetical protein
LRGLVRGVDVDDHVVPVAAGIARIVTAADCEDGADDCDGCAHRAHDKRRVASGRACSNRRYFDELVARG